MAHVSHAGLQTCRLMAELQPTDDERALIREAFRYLPDCQAVLHSGEGTRPALAVPGFTS